MTLTRAMRDMVTIVGLGVPLGLVLGLCALVVVHLLVLIMAWAIPGIWD